MRKNPVLLLTACINPNGMTFTMLQNPKIRATQYMEAIKWYLSNTDFDIVVVENTGYDLRSKFKNISSIEKRIEFLSFKGNDYDKRLGKGYGEGIIVKYAFEHSLFIKIHTEVIKITGKHIVTNVNMIWTSIRLFKMFNKEYVASYLPNSSS